MNSKGIYQAVKNIAATSSNKGKLELLKSYLQDGDFCAVVHYVLNPNITFGIEKVEMPDSNGESMFDKDTHLLLDDLYLRRLTGNEAKESVQNELKRLEPDSANLLLMVIRKNLQAGFSTQMVNKVKKGMIPTTSYMRCSLADGTTLSKLDFSGGIFSQEKADGMFGNVSYYATDDIEITSRDGKQFPLENFAEIVADVKSTFIPEYQYHGEFIVKENGKVLPREIGNGYLNGLINGLGKTNPDYHVHYNVWDMVKLSDIRMGKSLEPYVERFEIRLANLVLNKNPEHISLIDTYVCNNEAMVRSHYRKMISEGKEGIIIKTPDMIWRDGTSKQCFKMKVEFAVDLEIVGINTGKEGTRLEGIPATLSLVSSDGELCVTSTIKNETMRESVKNNPDEWIGKVIEVKGNNILPPTKNNPKWSIFLPRFSEPMYRTDKTEPDSLERCKEQYNNTLLG